ncbi:MAG: 4'-phosphopantetheinyl transferase superfamily protein [Oscillospiraceae bacterium]|nr:4'-phosphopantetheinyl transferase superfamily protein [Oscillospiraceae bacterium]
MMLTWQRLEGHSGQDVGRELLAALYREKTGKSLPPIAIGERGKPYFVDSPFHFSISHSKNHAFCALAEHPVGIDAEELDRKISPRLAEKILSPSEKLRYEAAEDKHLTLLKFWVLKEASVKLTGEGLRGYPNHTDFDPEDHRVSIIDGCLVAVLEEESHAF